MGPQQNDGSRRYYNPTCYSSALAPMAKIAVQMASAGEYLAQQCHARVTLAAVLLHLRS